ncbi:hypothetical protein GLOIN_2v1630930 [Rhizophagus irregularis DAOM 181602=DAOM 197198]|uniref:Uncharacterized protein n=1 Tax=Rhizophagus irregularis (strain DAOM 181602 / DAOM 197198 / MUCL 43194) TaxID=747089 RepID=A0A2P4PUE9_RHIID|nr:hypothetical protein GLOIN_2v1630930 [Rhizophagus irregularis DAOM 181602=DAOM 197198]POG69011.1 hypothetical protein GLOIN_2v1630930 [Rhizophagus irregularis DAOM 181602=DAOM 197198]GET56519.1 hypothetical protein GLOIN_2v1630930 [Rhizophagus irregularis DAOM 181602=DAOM 197198]|eukprot:XP_025175877.1 hypothetical protein GLOIN_2v1630930 [Rhizophagus irregularis DAOM 181602=DAOM 197198]
MCIYCTKKKKFIISFFLFSFSITPMYIKVHKYNYHNNHNNHNNNHDNHIIFNYGSTTVLIDILKIMHFL